MKGVTYVASFAESRVRPLSPAPRLPSPTAYHDAKPADGRNRTSSSSPRQRRPPNPTPAPDATDNRISQLKQLGELKDQGVLSEDEFQQQKARILGSG